MIRKTIHRSSRGQRRAVVNPRLFLIAFLAPVLFFIFTSASGLAQSVRFSVPLAGASLEQAKREFNLPEPNGCYSVGTKTMVLIDQRRKRDLIVTVWYPAAEGKSPIAPYMDKRTAEVVGEDWKLETGFERHVKTHARISAPVAAGTFPIVLLEHGSGTVPSAYTILAEGLASSGFVVVATNHTPDSLIAVFPDGREVRFTPYWPADADRKSQGIAIGKFAEDVLVSDVRFVLDKLEGIAAQDRFWRGHLDLAHVGIVGHSMGGTTAALATKVERRITAGVNLDGSTYPGLNADVRPLDVSKPFLFIQTEEHASDPETRGREFVGSQSNTYYVVLAEADHMSFTDLRVLASQFSRESRPDKTKSYRALLAIESTRWVVQEFLIKYLKDGGAPALDLPVLIIRK